MSDAANGNGTVPGDRAANMVRYQKKDFWSGENLRYSQPHFRMEKAALIVKRIAHGEERSLLDIGCGPATLARLLPGNIQYHGIDIAIHDPAPNLIEADLVGTPIRFNDQRFDIVIAQGFFEYVGDVQSQKFAEIADSCTKRASSSCRTLTSVIASATYTRHTTMCRPSTIFVPAWLGTSRYADFSRPLTTGVIGSLAGSP